MSNIIESPKKRLEEIIREGIAIDLYHVEEVLSLSELIGGKADQINAATFGAFFGSLQTILGRFLVLQIVRIFDQPSIRYRIRSIPAAIDILRKNCNSLVIEQRPSMIRALSRAGTSPEKLEHLSDQELTYFVAEFFNRQISDSYPEGVDNARAILTLKTARDKNVAHSEAIRLDELPKTTISDIRKLVTLAQEFLGITGSGYLSTFYKSDAGNYYMSSDAKSSTVCLRRLLEKANVIQTNNTYGK